MGFTKLHGTIIHSSMWQEDSDTRVVWITMLALADATGTVYASIGGLSHAARVSRQACERAIAKFLGPDPDSRDRTTGERIREVDGGWFIINHANYRDRQTREQVLAAERQRKWRQAHGVTGNDRNVTERDVTLSASNPSASVSASSASVQGEVQEREPRKRKVGLSWDVPCPEDVDPELWNEWLSVRKAKRLAPPTERAITKIRHDAEDRGMSLYAALQHCCERGHGGFYPDDKKDRR